MDLVKLLKKLRYYDDALSSILYPSKAKILKEKNQRLELHTTNIGSVVPINILEDKKDNLLMVNSIMNQTNPD